MKRFFAICFILIALSSCGYKQEQLQENKKKDFFIELRDGKSFSKNSLLKKTGQVSSSQDITLSSNANGRVQEIYVKNGDAVQKGQILARIQDNIGSYGINVDRAAIAVERAKINYESNKLSLDKQVFDSQLSLETLERNLETLKKDSQQNIIQAQDTLSSSQYGNLDSKSALQLEQLDNNIEKLKLDYDIKLISDREQIEGYKATLKKDYNTLVILLDDIIQFCDELLGVSEINDGENDDFEDFLGAKDLEQKSDSESALRELINYKESSEFQNIDTLLTGNITQEEMLEIIDYNDEGYEKLKNMLNLMEGTLNNSLESSTKLSEATLDSHIASVNGFQSQLQSNYGAFITFGTTVRSFLRTYEDNQASLLKNIELQIQDREIQFKNLSSSEVTAQASYERTILGIDDGVADLQDQIKTAKNNLENTKRSRDISLRSLQNAIDDARVSYTSALKEYEKLTITAPISGTVSDSFIDVGQEVFSGNNLFRIVHDNTPEIEVSFSFEEKSLVKKGQEVYVRRGGETITGSIYAISDVADENLNYKATILFDSGTNIIGTLATLDVPIETDKMLIPVNLITIQGDNIGTLKVFSGSTFGDVRVRVGEIYGENIEIVSCAKNCDELKIIMNDISKFDENKFVIVEK